MYDRKSATAVTDSYSCIVGRQPMLNKKLSYRRETAHQIRTSFSVRSLIEHFTEHRICCTTI